MRGASSRHDENKIGNLMSGHISMKEKGQAGSGSMHLSGHNCPTLKQKDEKAWPPQI